MAYVALRVHEDGADDERISQLTAYLRAELQELAPVSGVAADVTVAAGLLVRATHVTLPVAAAIVAYFSRSR